MELMFQWFWIVKYASIALVLFFAWKAISLKFESLKRNALALIALVFSVIIPVKLETNTREVQIESNNAIKDSKVLPEKMTDNSFKESTKNLGIKDEELK